MEKNISCLSDVSQNCDCRITELKFNDKEKRRFLDLGIIPGTIIKSLGVSPLGDPTAYFVRGTVIALRKSDCAKIGAQNLE